LFIVLSRNDARFRLILSETIRKTGVFACCHRADGRYHIEETNESAPLRCARRRSRGDSCGLLA
jgi:hypothetical protein